MVKDGAIPAMITQGDYTMETHTKIYDDKYGAAIEVGPDAELMTVRVRTQGKESEQHFGKFEISVDPELALMLGSAIIATAMGMGAKGKPNE